MDQGWVKHLFLKVLWALSLKRLMCFWTLDLLKYLCIKSNCILDLKTIASIPVVQTYLNNRTCYDKFVCTILFSSRWWVYWYELFSVLSTLQKINGKILMKRQVYNKGIFANFGQFLTMWDIDIIRMYSWFWVKWCN